MAGGVTQKVLLVLEAGFAPPASCKGAHLTTGTENKTHNHSYDTKSRAFNHLIT